MKDTLNVPETVTVNAPRGKANALLNGSTGFVIERKGKIAKVLLLDGKEAGREWLFMITHLQAK